MMEDIHSEMYAKLIENLIHNTKEKVEKIGESLKWAQNDLGSILGFLPKGILFGLEKFLKESIITWWTSKMRFRSGFYFESDQNWWFQWLKKGP